ncbi:hypothetical protein FOZ63_010046 [Perkinsus olseni]|uniref:Uncharacterized protein n=1 Tax=Perkinsus olseni TaxID=32597 RepID=A0A7J6TFJ4_PEROL|nr:hypothetical protein FOZ63_010046 [Perkinsus olseni]
MMMMSGARQAAAAAAAKAAQERARKDEAAKKSAILERFAVEGGDSSKAGVVAEAKAVKPQLKLFVPSQVRSSTSKTAAAAPPELITLDSDKVHIKKKPKQEVPPVGQQHPQGGGMKRSAAPPTGSLEDDFDRFMGEVNEMGVED